MASKTINIIVKIWRQNGPLATGALEEHALKDISTDSSFLEMIDVLNEWLTRKGLEPIAFDHDCREGICGQCGAVVNGTAHGPEKETTLCQLHMRSFKNNDTIVIEPFRSQGFPIIKDLIIDRSGLDRIIQAGGYVSVNTGSPQDGNTILIPQHVAEQAMDAAACIGCGACAAACPNGSPMLFLGAKVSQLALLPQGQLEAKKRAINMVMQMDKDGFGNCGNHRECENVCPKGISIRNIARLNRQYLRAAFTIDH
ncbi:succinate dehydrogenase/fumarate reductase iron-sulfur subunit [Desulfobulbus alkaliphilus]|uniref:succinate dehydrogenase/fumarate reductase iron-sulfur subunit n=1 Tax=Desulfobulbus alkaliphilus TaxID=869814 RepID=UPI001962B8FE|nr:succinate dehydrogenase/fumarate reductase iron-sulfur subunit [Desulfobulbus alkaliphilus]MBM9536443.1 succinate dehydrogenase/fumarate reductase iron-sulfur subunit [Desulfobulbus alkaliphilus]